ncbi:MAG TPA: hypothetical protein VI055_19930, partial [Rubrobacter sp.]
IHRHVCDSAVLLEQNVLVGLLGFDHGASFRVGFRDQMCLSSVLTLRSTSSALEEVDEGRGGQQRRNDNQEEAKGTARERGPNAQVDQSPPPEQAHQKQERRAAGDRQRAKRRYQQSRRNAGRTR